MTAVFITVYRQQTQPKIYEERSVQGQINQIISNKSSDHSLMSGCIQYCLKLNTLDTNEVLYQTNFVHFNHSVFFWEKVTFMALFNQGGDAKHKMLNEKVSRLTLPVSSRGPLPMLFKICPWGHNFTLNYIRKTSNDFFP